MKKKTSTLFLCFALSSLALSLCAVCSVFNGDSLTKANEKATNYCADITFGSEKFTGSNTLSSFSFTLTNISASVDDVSKCYGYTSAGQYAARIGSGSAGGSFTLSFSNSLPLSSLRVLAFQYESGKSPTLTIKDDSSYSAAQTVTGVTSSTQIGDCLGSDWLSYTGFDGSVSSLTFTSSARLLLAKVVFVMGDAPAYSSDYSSYSSNEETSSEDVSSSSNPSSSASKSSSSLISSSSSSVSSSKEESSEGEHSYPYDTSEYYTSYQNGTYINYIDLSPYTSVRLEPIVSEDGQNVSCYALKDDGTFRLVETLSKGGVYTDPNEVACYINAFNECPANYALYSSGNEYTFPSGTQSSANAYKTAYATYGSKTRLYTYYARTTGYVKAFPVDTTSSDFHYWEVDFDIDGTYASSSSKANRGAGRLVVFPYGVTTSSYASGANFIVKTLDHYQHAREFCNFLEGWGNNCEMECTDGDYESYSSLTNTTLSF